MWGCGLITAVLPPTQSFPVQCCFAAILHQHLKNLPVRLWTGLFGKCRPHLCFSQLERSLLMCKTSDQACSKQLFTARYLGTLLRFLSGFLLRQKAIFFSMFCEVLRGLVPHRVLPFLAAVLFQRKERRETGFYHWRVRPIVLSLRQHSLADLFGNDFLLVHICKKQSCASSVINQKIYHWMKILDNDNANVDLIFFFFY